MLAFGGCEFVVSFFPLAFKKKKGRKVQCFSKRKKDEQNTAWNRMEKGEPATSLMKAFC